MRLWLPVSGEVMKDLCWHNGDVMKIGPVVAAQHVVNC